MIHLQMFGLKKTILEDLPDIGLLVLVSDLKGISGQGETGIIIFITTFGNIINQQILGLRKLIWVGLQENGQLVLISDRKGISELGLTIT